MAEMYKVILVDDEIWTLQGIKKTFPWQNYGFTVIGATSDSAEAMEMILTQNPDVVFTDIKMSGYSGIDLLKAAKERGLKTKFIIISGYADFEFAQSAVRYGAYDYCLKPVSVSDAEELLEKLCESLNRENGIYEVPGVDTRISNEAFQKMILYINQNYTQKLKLDELAEKFGLNLTYCCHLFNVHMHSSFSKYITKLRMDKAASLLIERKKTIQEIADYIGYDYYHFNKAFKKYTGLTPMQYKNRNI